VTVPEQEPVRELEQVQEPVRGRGLAQEPVWELRMPLTYWLTTTQKQIT
jgi:hypothetical protein